jgi:hypothetical protein
MIRKLFVLFTVFMVVACGEKFSGTYVGQGLFAATSLTFQENGKVVINNMGIKAEVPYEIDGDQIKIMAMGGVVTKLKKDGSFELPGGATYIKK